MSRDFEGVVPDRSDACRPYGTGNNGVCSISSNANSNSNFNAEIPMPGFTNDLVIRCARSS